MVAKEKFEKLPRSEKKFKHAYSVVPKLELKKPPTALTNVSIEPCCDFLECTQVQVSQIVIILSKSKVEPQEMVDTV